MKKLIASILIVMSILTGCDKWHPQSDVKSNSATVLEISPTQLPEFGEYLTDVEEQTHRKITEEQKTYLYTYISQNSIKKLDTSVIAQHRKAFDNIKKILIKQWENNTRQKWPKYEKDVVIKGKIVRKIGYNYDAHHLVELSFGGPNEWWNIHPAAFPKEHQEGIHRKDGPASRLFDNETD